MGLRLRRIHPPQLRVQPTSALLADRISHAQRPARSEALPCKRPAPTVYRNKLLLTKCCGSAVRRAATRMALVSRPQELHWCQSPAILFGAAGCTTADAGVWLRAIRLFATARRGHSLAHFDFLPGAFHPRLFAARSPLLVPTDVPFLFAVELGRLLVGANDLAGVALPGREGATGATTRCMETVVVVFTRWAKLVGVSQFLPVWSSGIQPRTSDAPICFSFPAFPFVALSVERFLR